MRTALFLLGVVAALWLLGLVVTGDPFAAWGAVFHALGEGLRPLGESR